MTIVMAGVGAVTAVALITLITSVLVAGTVIARSM